MWALSATSRAGEQNGAEAEILSDSEKCYADIADGTVKPYENVGEMFAEWDKEDEEGEKNE